MITEEKYNRVINYLKDIIKGTEWENKVFTVGGCVRDLILKAPIKDIDLVIEKPEGGLKFASWLSESGFLVSDPVFYPTYGTSMFKLRKFKDLPLEAVCTRKERYLDHDSRNPETAFGTIEEDCFRRDLTINSLYHNISTGEIIDLSGGLNDIEKKVLRTTSDPRFIFEDDPLRMLRVIRFYGRLGKDWKIFPGIIEAIMDLSGRLRILSKERVQAEFSSMMIGPNPELCLRMMSATGILDVLFPEIAAMTLCEQGPQHYGNVFEHTIGVINKVEPELILRLSALLHDSGKPKCVIMKNGVPKFYGHESFSSEVAKKFLKRLKYSNEVIDEVVFLCENHMIFKQWGSKIDLKKLRKRQYEAGEERFIRLLKLVDADNKSHATDYCMPDQIENIKKSCDPFWYTYKLPISGNDIMEVKGIKPGPLVKRYIKYLLRYAFAHPKESSREYLLEELKHVKPNNLPKL